MVETGANDSLHIAGRPLRMIIQNVPFLISLMRITSDEELINLLTITIEHLQEAVY